jgi:hypothetical protein
LRTSPPYTCEPTLADNCRRCGRSVNSNRQKNSTNGLSAATSCGSSIGLQSENLSYIDLLFSIKLISLIFQIPALPLHGDLLGPGLKTAKPGASTKVFPASVTINQASTVWS